MNSTTEMEPYTETIATESSSSPLPSTDDELFPVLSDAMLRGVSEYGEVMEMAAGDVLFAEGEISDSFFVLLGGRIKVTRRVADGETVLAVHSAGQFTGEIGFLTEEANIATGVAVEPSWVVRLNREAFQQMTLECPEIREIIVKAMAKRRPEADWLMQQREKLAALGQMSAGLAHELNNPASAARGAAKHLRESLAALPALVLALASTNLSAEQSTVAIAFIEQLRQSSATTTLGALARSDREEEIADWLDLHADCESWQVAPILAESGVAVDELDRFAEQIPPAAISAIINFAGATLQMTTLAAEVEESSERIAGLVASVKSYTYMDQAGRQSVDLHEGIESTIRMLSLSGSKLKSAGIKIARDFCPEMPHIEAFGSELNQVWTNLIDNAVDALADAKTPDPQITIRTNCERDQVLVEICDNGPGIPDAIKPRLFEPFFTTKGIGKGTGLGLDIVHRIIVQHHSGDIRVFSEPGSTRFQVRLPTGE